MAQRAFLVIGPESSGTRLLTRILIQAGCLGQSGHSQRWDGADPVGDPIVWRRSFPHAGRWPNLPSIIQRLRDLEYELHTVVTTRDWWAMARSQNNGHQHVSSMEEAFSHIQEAYRLIFLGISVADACYTMVSYESLVLRGRAYLAWLMPHLGLPVPEIGLYDANAKWYGEG